MVTRAYSKLPAPTSSESVLVGAGKVTDQYQYAPTDLSVPAAYSFLRTLTLPSSGRNTILLRSKGKNKCKSFPIRVG